MFLYLIEGIVTFVAILFISTQVILPLLMGRPFFPIFRHKPYQDLAAAKEKAETVFVVLETSELERRVADYIKSRSQGEAPHASTDEPIRQPGKPEEPKGPDISSN